MSCEQGCRVSMIGRDDVLPQLHTVSRRRCNPIHCNPELKNSTRGKNASDEEVSMIESLSLSVPAAITGDPDDGGSCHQEPRLILGFGPFWF